MEAARLALVLALLPGCTIHSMEYVRNGTQVRSFDVTFLRVSNTALATGPSTISAPERQPLQRPDDEDEQVAEQFAALVALLERQGAQMRGEEMEPLPLPLIPYRPTTYTTMASGELSYLVEDREVSEDLTKLVRTGFLAAMYAYLLGYAGEAIGIGLDYLDSP